MVNAWIGVDPGAKGYLCLLVPDEKFIQHRLNIEQPVVLSLWLKNINKNYNLKMCVIEDVHAIFGTSAKSNFNFGFNTGLINGIIQASGLPLAKVQPKTWQKAVGCKSSNKDLKKEVGKLAQDLYPQADLTGPRGGLLDGKSDSLMIAHYAMLTYR